MNRRQFLRSAATAGAAWMAARSRAAAAGTPDPRGDETIRLGIIGTGTQGRTLMNACFLIPGVRFVAVCDIWDYSRTIAAAACRNNAQPVAEYVDYRDMLGVRNDLHAVIVATPDWIHAEQTVACLEAGAAVYCEKEMSNSLDGARKMVEAARRTGRLLQIGHQRRSNPQYLEALSYVRERKALGRLTHVEGHWRRARRVEQTWPKKYVIDDATLARYGYDTMDRFRNWRWYRKFSGGPIADLGSHQIDVFHWFLGALPEQVQATGGRDYYDDAREWYDNANALYKWICPAPEGPRVARGFYQVVNNSSYDGYYETFIGDEGAMEISEDTRFGLIRRESTVPTAAWEKRLARRVAEYQQQRTAEVAQGAATAGGFALNAAPSPRSAGRYYPLPLPGGYQPKPVHQWHLENFFDAIRGRAKLNCPPEVGYETAVSVLRVNEAISSGNILTFDEKEFRA